jgi:hypothetical protein
MYGEPHTQVAPQAVSGRSGIFEPVSAASSACRACNAFFLSVNLSRYAGSVAKQLRKKKYNFNLTCTSRSGSVEKPEMRPPVVDEAKT